jgi:hypothetical protein
MATLSTVRINQNEGGFIPLCACHEGIWSKKRR